jgi:lipoprotein NlpD
MRAALLLAVGCFMLEGCMTGRPAPVAERTPQQARPAPSVAKQAAPAPRAASGVYVVKPGDTLYSIALDHGLDYRELAAWNGLDNAAHIRVGQELRLTAPAPGQVPQTAVTTAPLKAPGGRVESRPLGAGGTATVVPVTPVAPSAPASTDKLKTGPKATRIPYSDQAWAQLNKTDTAQPATTLAEAKPEAKLEQRPDAKADAKPDKIRGPGELDWGWPTSGKVVGTFNGNTNKGIDIAGKAGQPVFAAAPGRVIFSGTGIRGLGKFVVIKHNNEYISVYGHNRVLLVKQDQSVAKGQKIAEMGDTDANKVQLHFEIRRFGNSVDPLKLLPDRG